MALIGNGLRQSYSPAVRLGQASTYVIDRQGWNQPGARRNFYAGEATVISGASVANKSAFPMGYLHPGAWLLPIKPGGMASSRNGVDGDGDITFGNLAGGLNGEAVITGIGTISNAAIVWIIVATAALSGASTTSADITGRLDAVAALVGVGDLEAAIAAALNAAATLTGTGTLTGAAAGALEASAALAGAGDLVGAITGVIQAVSALSGSGTINNASLTAIWDMLATMAGSSSVVASLTALGHMLFALTAGGTVTGNFAGTTGDMSADITVSGDTLTTLNVGDAVWQKICEAGLTYQDVQRILLAVAAGKTTINNLGGGLAEVSFRDQADSKDRVFAEMTNSERTTVTVDPT